MKRKTKLIKNKCEIETCEVNDPRLLHLHHIVERTESNTTNNIFNLAILCANCHHYVHCGRIKIIGIYPSTRLPNKRTLIYEFDGVANVEGVTSPYATFENKSYKIIGEKDE